jgi:hypothetical protein
MELFRGNKDNSLSHIIETITNKDVELEVIFGVNEHKNPIHRSEFMRLLELCKTDYKLVDEVSTLDIRHEFKQDMISNIRCSIQGIDFIKQYCKTDSLEGIEDHIQYLIKKPHTSKDGTKFETIKDNDYNLRMTLKDEFVLSTGDSKIIQFLKQHETSKKHFRYKKRFSFLTQDKIFRIDLTVVKSTRKNKGKYNLKKRFREADILSQPEFYELEIEYVGDQNGFEDNQFSDLYKLLEEQKQLLRPGQRITGNDYNPLTINTPFQPSEESEITFEPILNYNMDDVSYDIESPRYNPDGGIGDIDYTDTKYSEYIGKNIRIKENFWRQNPSISYIKIKMDEAFELVKKQLFHRPRSDGVVIDIQEIFQEEIQDYKSFAEVSIFPEVEDTKSLLVPIEDIYDYSTETDTPKQLPDWAPSGILKEDVKMTLSRNIILLLKEHIIHLSKIIYETDTLISQSVRESVIRIYKELTYQTKSPYFKLKGPQPITLEKKHININTPSNILINYAVTEKADGERYQLLITKHRGYLINSKQNVIDTGNVFRDFDGEWLFDGEYITKDKTNKPIQSFMIFDVYWNGNKTPQPIYTYPFFVGNSQKWQGRQDVSRHLTLLAFQVELYSAIKLPGAISIGVKEYEYGHIKPKDDEDDVDTEDLMGIFEVSKQLLQQNEEGFFPYRIDGLIYMPIQLSVNSLVEGSPVKNIGGEWKYNYKWKPPEENTIDFLVKTVKIKEQGKLIDQTTPISKVYEDGRKELKQYKQLGMYVGYDKNQDTTIDYCMSILQGYPSKLSNEKIQLFTPPGTNTEVHLTNIILDDGKMYCTNIDRDEIRDGDIVEMRYNGVDEKDGIVWSPLRVRRDKQKPQFFTTSYKIWETIQDPVTSEMIQGALKQKLITGNVSGEYYISDKQTHSNMEPLRKFHNMIKKKLIVGVSSLQTKPKILDLSCGRGGDIQKYLHKDVNPSFLMGMDISSNVSEACQRYYNEKTKVKGVFLRGDTSQNILTRKCINIPDITEKERNHSETMLRLLYNKEIDEIPDNYNSVVSNYKGVANDGFDIISSQFSIHYYFKNEQTLQGFLQNVTENISSGGYFIGMCYDGQKVFDIEDTMIEMKDTMGNLMYKIDKKYSISSFTFDETDTSNMLGNEIDVYMDSIGQSITEYLVNFDYLTYVMKERGFQLVNPTNVKRPHSSIFQKKYINQGYGDFELIVNDLDTFKSNNDPDYKHKMDPMMYDEELKRLTSLNKYFIFQRE